jgi:hypothetical protein
MRIDRARSRLAPAPCGLLAGLRRFRGMKRRPILIGGNRVQAFRRKP